MREMAFFQEIEHVEVPWGERTIHCPLFFYDVRSLNVHLLAPIQRVKELFPSHRINPYRVSPWHCIVSISAFEYRDCDLGPYNEISVGIPFVLDRQSPLFTGVLRKAPEITNIFIYYMPVTTEIARDSGVEFGGFPKILADIKFEEDGEWVSCSLSKNGAQILTITGRKLNLSPFPRYYVHPVTFRRGHLLRCEFLADKKEEGFSRDSSDVRLELYDHPLAQELGKLGLGRILAYQYSPQFQAILTPVCESYAV